MNKNFFGLDFMVLIMSIFAFASCENMGEILTATGNSYANSSNSSSETGT